VSSCERDGDTRMGCKCLRSWTHPLTVCPPQRDGSMLWRDRTQSKRRRLMLIRRTILAALLVGGLTAVASAQPNGRSTLMPAYYDDQIFQVNFTELASEDTLIAHNGSINFIYMSDECMPGGNMFVAVIDAIQGDGFNPLWQEVQIHFDNPDFP